MPQIRCPYCHEYFDVDAFSEHKAKHERLRPDGQLTDYVTLPEEDREQGDLAGVPQVYVHLKCGTGTGMPEDIIRSYLQNPYMYTAYRTFCCGCGIHVPYRECVWTETGEDLHTYFDKLRAAKPEMKPKGCSTGMLVMIALLAAAIAFLVVAGIVKGQLALAVAAGKGGLARWL